MRLAGKVAVVTGSSSGIGQATAAALAAEGAAVVGFARRYRKASFAAADLVAGQVLEIALDVGDEHGVDARFAALPRLDIVVASHGTGTFAPIATASVDDLRQMLGCHVVGTFLIARAALRHMKVQRAGHVVIVSSNAAQQAFAECAGYTAAKAGQLGFARVLAAEARPYDVRVTSVLPGATDTPIWDERPGFDRQKMLRPGDVAGVIVDLVARPQVAIDQVVVMPPAGAL
ncbi:MAG: SDR family oxidoreductase [Deltaproteobacteria bacterium]|nr:SDR family oxidoreductase [Deltaproteobacteria bacterium]